VAGGALEFCQIPAILPPDGELPMVYIRLFLANEDGPTAVEYAVMLAMIMVACITIVTALGTSSSRTFSRVNGALAS
jgi:pilus assembly protein Flp/PilA